jgi:hypothetical protein
VFLYELRDIKRMFHFIPPKHFSFSNWRSLLAYANKQHLNYNFGWKPFVKHVKNVFNGISSLDERLTKFLVNQNQDLHRNVGDEAESYEDTQYLCPDGMTDGVRIETTYTVSGASAFQYRYSAPDYGAQELRWRAMADTVGLNANPSTIWAVLPWSFVVDWFYDVSGLLRQSESDWVQPWVEFIQACSTVKVSSVSEVGFRFRPPGYDYPWNTFAKMTTHRFHRSGLARIVSSGAHLTQRG